MSRRSKSWIRKCRCFRTLKMLVKETRLARLRSWLSSKTSWLLRISNFQSNRLAARRNWWRSRHRWRLNRRSLPHKSPNLTPSSTSPSSSQVSRTIWKRSCKAWSSSSRSRRTRSHDWISSSGKRVGLSRKRPPRTNKIQSLRWLGKHQVRTRTCKISLVEAAARCDHRSI